MQPTRIMPAPQPPNPGPAPNDALLAHEEDAVATTRAATVAATLQATRAALSKDRLDAYRLPSDADLVDALARYAYNLALCAAAYPLLHTLEVTLRNRVYRAVDSKYPHNARANAGVPCWLDFTPPILTTREVDMVAEAKRQCGRPRKGRPRAPSPGRLVAALPFGFWANLLNAPYEHGNPAYGRLWPKLLKPIFPSMPPEQRTRERLLRRVSAIKDFRNRVFHYEPVWHDDFAGEHGRLLETLDWMSRDVGRVARAFDTVPGVLGAGPAAFRRPLEAALGTS